jgi:hypothetical protein
MSCVPSRCFIVLSKRVLATVLLTFCVCVGLGCKVRSCLQLCLRRLCKLRCLGQRRFYRSAKTATPKSLVALARTASLSTTTRIHHKAKPDRVKPELLRLMAHMPQASVRLLATTFNRLYLALTGISVGRSFVYAFRLRCRATTLRWRGVS